MPKHRFDQRPGVFGPGWFTAMLVMMVCMAVKVNAGPGDLDPSFGQGGRVFTPVAVPTYDLFYPNTESILVQPDGRILVCGRFWEDFVSYWYGTFIVRYMPDGTLDQSFGENGKVAVIGSGYPHGNPAVGADMALQTDGKIILIGQETIAEGIIVQRYTSGGALDTTFGNNGRTVVSGVAFEEGSSITVQPDGKIVGVGWEYNPFITPYYDAILVFRLNMNGSLDNSFGGTGVVTIEDGYDGPEVIVQPDGKILVVGTLLNFADIPSTLMLARYNANGSLDPNFGTGGRVLQRINQMDSIPSGAALQPDGKIVVAGSIYSDSAYQPFFARFNADGSPDTGFGTNGVLLVERSFFKLPNTVLLDDKGRIVASGNAYDGASGYDGFSLLRITSSGSLDPSFGVGGRSVFPINAGGTNYASGSNGVIQQDGKILVTGFFGYYFTDSHDKIALIRVDGGGRARFDFDGDGRSDVSVFRPSAGVWYLDRSSAGFSATQFGVSADVLAATDYDRDGKTDIAVFRDGTWWVIKSLTNTVDAVSFGQAGDIPVPADYTGDGRDELAVYRNGQWWSYDLSIGTSAVVNFGLATDLTVPADYDGDGRVDQAVYRNGDWHLNRSSQGYAVVSFGLATDLPVTGDYDGDGRSDQAIYRNGEWHINRSTLGYNAFNFGLGSDVPAPADYDGDGRADAAVFRDGIWYLLQSTGGFAVRPFGVPGDLPVPASYLP